MAYATTAQLALRWRALSPAEIPIAEQLLKDAATIIDASGADVSDISADVLGIVSCDMVRRAMSANGDSFALGSTVDALAFTPMEANGGLANNLWLSYDNKKLLKIYDGKYFTVRPKIGYDNGEW